MTKIFLIASFSFLLSCSLTPTFTLQGSSNLDKSGLAACNGYPHGSVIHGYTRKMAPCSEASRTCINGSWNGPEVYPTCQ